MNVHPVTMLDLPATRHRAIVHVPRRYVAHEWGGTETVVQEISRCQQHAGWSPVIVTSMALASSKRESIAGIPVRRHPYCYPYLGLDAVKRAALDKKGGNLLSLSLAADLLTRSDVRLYHAHTLKRVGGTVRTVARLRRRPFVVSLHGGIFDVPEAKRSGLVRPIDGHLEWGRVWGALVGSRRVLHDADHVICVGHDEAEKARAALPHGRVSHLPNGVDCQRFADGDGALFRSLHGIAADEFVVMNISRIDAQKDQMTLVDAFARFRHRQPKARLVIIGPETQPEYAASLRERIAQSGLGGSVTLLPGIPNSSRTLVDALHACDVFVLPSRHEPFGIVALEAWSAGRLVIASRVGGLRTLISDGTTGWHFEPGRPDELAGAIALAADRPAWNRRIAEAGRAEARARYDWKRVTAELELIYQQAEEHAAGRVRS
jgi:glycosyltransferase involved in cell wall biosynthesis